MFEMSRKKNALLGLAVALGLLGASRAHAGWREMGLVMVPMHAKDDASARACYTRLRKQLTGQEGSDVVHIRQSRDNVAKKLGDEVMASWKTAEAKAFEPLVKWEPKTWRDFAGKTIGSGYVIDAWVLIDCQPEAKTLDVVTIAPKNNTCSPSILCASLFKGAHSLPLSFCSSASYCTVLFAPPPPLPLPAASVSPAIRSF